MRSVCISPDSLIQFLNAIKDNVEIALQEKSIIVFAEVGPVVWNYIQSINQFCASIPT